MAVVSGGNIDITCLGRVLQRGMAADGRLTQFTLTISDRPGGAADLTKLLAECGATYSPTFRSFLTGRGFIRAIGSSIFLDPSFYF